MKALRSLSRLISVHKELRFYHLKSWLEANLWKTMEKLFIKKSNKHTRIALKSRFTNKKRILSFKIQKKLNKVYTNLLTILWPKNIASRSWSLRGKARKTDQNLKLSLKVAQEKIQSKQEEIRTRLRGLPEMSSNLSPKSHRVLKPFLMAWKTKFRLQISRSIKLKFSLSLKWSTSKRSSSTIIEVHPPYKF
jgi:hypothetical protein